MKKLFLPALVLFVLLCLGLMPAMAAGYPESKHPYDDNTDTSWSYTFPGTARYLKVTFSADSATEAGWDFLYVTDAEGNVLKLTGSLSGRTVYLKGSSFTLRLTSDDLYNAYGFAIASIASCTEEEYLQPRYEINSSGTIIGYTGGAAQLSIPQTVDGITVTGLAGELFRGNNTLIAVTIPNSVTSIGYGTFISCSNLKSVTLPANLTSIGTYAFADCDRLESVTIPSGVTSIEDYTFYSCGSLKMCMVR